jgi:hypothetical protein
LWVCEGFVQKAQCGFAEGSVLSVVDPVASLTKMNRDRTKKKKKREKKKKKERKKLLILDGLVSNCLELILDNFSIPP